MAKPKPPAKPPKPKCPPHQWKFPAITNDHIEHECKKCGTKTKRPKGKNSKAVMAAAAILAALIPISAARCGGGMGAHTQNWWENNPQYRGDFIVFQPKAPAGQWEMVGRRVRGQPGVRVWIHRNPP